MSIHAGIIGRYDYYAKHEIEWWHLSISYKQVGYLTAFCISACFAKGQKFVADQSYLIAWISLGLRSSDEVSKFP